MSEVEYQEKLAELSSKVDALTSKIQELTRSNIRLTAERDCVNDTLERFIDKICENRR